MAKNTVKPETKPEVKKASAAKKNSAGIMEGFTKWARGSKLKYSTLSKAFTVAFLIVLVLINVIFSLLGNRFPSMNIDLTTKGLNTLSDKAEEVAKEVTHDTVIYLIGKEDYYRTDQIYSTYNVKYSQVINLVEKFCEINPHITYQCIDPDSDPSFMSQYADLNMTTGYVLVQSDLRYKVLGPTDLFDIQTQTDSSGNTTGYDYYSMVDNALANGVYLCNLETVPVVAVATGHNEMLGSSNRSSFDELLKTSNYEVKEFDVLTEDIPENTQLLMLAAPSTDYTKEELEKIDTYLNTQGDYSRALLVTFHPTQGSMPNLTEYLQEWGIEVGAAGSSIYESSSNNTYMAYDSYIFADYVSNDAVTMDKAAYDTLIAPMSVELSLNKDINSNVELYTMVQSRDTSYVFTAGMTEAAKSAAAKGTHPLVALSQKQWSQGSQFYSANVIACASSYMFTSTFIDTTTFDNRDFITNMVAFATDTYDNSTGLYVESVQTYALDVTATSATVKFMGIWVFTVGIPAVILIYGTVIYFKRRHL